MKKVRSGRKSEKFSRDRAKINQLMADPKLREKFGKAGRKRAQQIQLVRHRPEESALRVAHGRFAKQLKR